eukprot:TRINITY_DN205_c0_g2_i3.p1 TRINITY_DN205_c0_g2~~TRINITY_DN205_c0_g2_i3.p1  ORF type:complete len:432 (-),score=67.68 TRINITY_DN205_c0_g2_i3:414-1709(-)
MNILRDKDGRAVGQPPVHYHHFHTYEVNSLLPIWPHMVFVNFEAHGDDDCDQHGLGAMCHMKISPPGYGEHVAPRHFVDSVVNWVEDLHMDPEAEFWIETNLRVTYNPEVTTTVPFLMGNIPFLPTGSIADAGTYPVPKNTESMTWNVLKYPEFDFELLWWKTHYHALFLDEVWVLEGDGAEILGLDQDPFILDTPPLTWDDFPKRAEPVEPSSYGTIENYMDNSLPLPMDNLKFAKREILDLGPTRFNNTNAVKIELLRRLKAWNEANPDRAAEFIWMHGHGPALEGEANKSYSSRTPLTPNKYDFKAGEVMTTIAFHNNVACNDACMAGEPVRMHVATLIDRLPKDPLVKFLMTDFGFWLLYLHMFQPASFWTAFVISVSVLLGLVVAGCVACCWVARPVLAELRDKCSRLKDRHRAPEYEKVAMTEMA